MSRSRTISKKPHWTAKKIRPLPQKFSKKDFMTSRPLHHWILLALLVLGWGSAFAFTKLALTGMPPEWIVALRLVLGAVPLVLLLFVSGERMAHSWRAWGWFVLLSVVGNVLPFFAISWGQQKIDSALAGILIGATPIITLAIAPFFTKDERITPGRIAGFLIGFAGLVLVIGPSALTEIGTESTELLSQLAILGGATCFAFNNVLAKVSPDLEPLTKAAGVMVTGALLGTLGAETLGPPAAYAAAGPTAWIGMAALGVFSTGAAAVVFFRLVDAAGATFTALTNYLVPVFAAFAGYVFFGEHLSWLVLAGLALILSGIALSELNIRRLTEKARDEMPLSRG